MARIVNIIVRVTKTHKAPSKIELKKVEKHSKILRVLSLESFITLGFYADSPSLAMNSFPILSDSFHDYSKFDIARIISFLIVLCPSRSVTVYQKCSLFDPM